MYKGCQLSIKDCQSLQVEVSIAFAHNNCRINDLVSYTHWLLQQLGEGAKSNILPSIFSFEMPRCSFPDPSLALTITLGNIFLPFVAGASESQRITPLLTVNGRLCLFYMSLIETDTQLLDTLERSKESNILNRLIHFLLLHSALVKDKLALPTANTLWIESSEIGESEFIQFQANCIDMINKVFHVWPFVYFRLLRLLVKS